MDSKGNAWCAKAGSQMLVVAERLVLRFAAAAKGRARQGLDGAVLMPDFDLAAHQQRPVTNRRHRGRPIGILIRRAVEAPVEQGAARAPPDDLGHLVRACQVGQDPWSPVEVEDLPLSPQALGDMDAEFQVEADLHISPAIDLPHPVQHTMDLIA